MLGNLELQQEIQSKKLKLSINKLCELLQSMCSTGSAKSNATVPLGK
jgi:hypothetical protein